MFTKLGRKIMKDAGRTPPASAKPVASSTVVDDENDDAFYRFKGGRFCEEGNDVYYHGGHDHGDEDDGLTEDERYDKAMYQLKCVLVIGIVFVGAQGFGAYLANSIAIATDCAHLATDLIAFIMSIVALGLTRRGSSVHYTFGWHRSETIGAITSIMFLLTLTVWLLVEAMQRVFVKYEIDGTIMLITAVLSLIFNLMLMKVLHQGHDHDHDHGGHSHGHSHGPAEKKKGGHGHSHGHNHEGGHSHGHEKKGGHSHGHKENGHSHGHSHGDLKLGKQQLSAAEKSMKKVKEEQSQNMNVTAAYLHILGDLLLSIGVIISATVIYLYPTEEYPWSKYFDPACTLIFSIVICYTCKETLSQGIFILMEGAPQSVDTLAMLKDIKNQFKQTEEEKEQAENMSEQELKELQAKLDKIPGVIKTVHDFHCWSLSKGKYSMSSHIVVNTEIAKSKGLTTMDLLKSSTKIVNGYGIDHCTIQMEEDVDCDMDEKQKHNIEEPKKHDHHHDH